MSSKGDCKAHLEGVCRTHGCGYEVLKKFDSVLLLLPRHKCCYFTGRFILEQRLGEHLCASVP